MTMFTHFKALLDAGSPVTPQGLQLAEAQVDSVINAIDLELTALDPDRFESDAHIPAGSFGGADRAPSLALHHQLAHEVTVATLRGVKEDLVAFRTACQRARLAIQEADLYTADELRWKKVAVDALATGAFSDRGSTAHTNAQHEQDAPTEGDQ